MKFVKLLILLTFALAFSFKASHDTSAQEAFTGTWKIERCDDKDRKDDAEGEKRDRSGDIQLSLERRTENGRNNHGNSYKISDFEGLSWDQINSANTVARFRMVREAGTIDFDGVFRNGVGSGT